MSSKMWHVVGFIVFIAVLYLVAEFLRDLGVGR